MVRTTHIARKKVGQYCQFPAEGPSFPTGILASSTSLTDRREMTEVLLKVELHSNQTNKQYYFCWIKYWTCKYAYLNIWFKFRTLYSINPCWRPCDNLSRRYNFHKFLREMKYDSLWHLPNIFSFHILLWFINYLLLLGRL